MASGAPAAAAAPTTTHAEGQTSAAAADAAAGDVKESRAPSSNAAVGSKQQSSNNATMTEKVVETVKKYIPGLSKEPTTATAGPTTGASAKRSRSSKSKKSTSNVANAQDPALATATLAEAPERSELPDELKAPVQDNHHHHATTTTGHGLRSLNGEQGMTEEELAELQQKRFSPALMVQKRLRANNKKLQRIATYEQETGALNADQKKALASKPALEAVQRELSEIIKAFEVEEAEEEKRIAKKQQYEEKQVQLRIHQAVANSKVDTQNDLTLLLQFLHLYSLFSPSGQSFAPPTLPPVVANATGQQHAAVHTLFNNLANGPLFGGPADSEDAVSQIQYLHHGSDKAVVEGVTFSDIRQMILDLTAPPAEVGHEIPVDEAAAAASHPGLGGASDLGSVPAHEASPAIAPEEGEAPFGSNEGAAPASSLNFMQASELAQPAEQGSFVGPDAVAVDAPDHQRALESVSASATPGYGSGTPVVEKSEATAVEPPVGGTWNAGPQLSEGTLPTASNGWEEEPRSEPITSWADEVDDANPSNPFTTTPDVPAELAGQQSADTIPVGGEAVDTNTAEGGRGRGRGRGRGGRGRGSGGEYRGRGPRGGGGSSGEWRNRQNDSSAPDSAVKAVLSAAGDGFTDVHRRGHGHRESGGGGGGYRGSRGRGDGSHGEYRGRGGGRGRGGPRNAAGQGQAQGAPNTGGVAATSA